MEPQAICHLAAGNLSQWHGLQPFALSEAPTCLEATGLQGWFKFNLSHLAYHVFRLKSVGSDVWLFTFDDGAVHLIEVFGLPSNILVGQLLDQLGVPERQLDYPLAAQLQRPLRRADEEVSECVFAGRGLALLIGQAAQQVMRLVRVRGFEVMPAQRYRELFVDLPPPRFFPE